jgi:hypothetical protein
MSVDFRSSPTVIEALEILEVIQEPGEDLRGHFRVLGRDRRLEIVGWALGEELAATEVLVIADGVQVAVSTVDGDRPDVAGKYPDRPAAAGGGFRIELLGEGGGQSLLELFALLEDQTREPLGRILCRSRS